MKIYIEIAVGIIVFILFMIALFGGKEQKEDSKPVRRPRRTIEDWTSTQDPSGPMFFFGPDGKMGMIPPKEEPKKEKK